MKQKKFILSIFRLKMLFLHNYFIDQKCFYPKIFSRQFILEPKSKLIMILTVDLPAKIIQNHIQAKMGSFDLCFDLSSSGSKHMLIKGGHD